MFTTSLTANDLLFLLQGAWTTLAITAMAMLIGTLLGVVFGLLRALLPRASLPLAALLDVFRSVPLLIQFVLLNSFKSILGLDWSAFAVACLVLGLYAPPPTAPRWSAAASSRYRRACAGRRVRWA